MAITTTTRLGVTRWSSGADAFSRSQMDASHAALETNAAMYAQDVIASRPSAGKSGRVFWATDESKLYYDNGVTWTSIGSGVFLPLSGGTLSGALTAATSYTVTGGSVLAATSLTIGSSTTSATLTAGAGTHSLELGRRDGSSSPVMNFHSSGNDISYDSRIVASGGSGSVGQGILSLTAAGGINLNSASVSSAGLVSAAGLTTSAALTLSDANVVLGTTTGTKIGTSTSQKLGFFNATPIVQPSGNISTALSNLGLVSSGTLNGTDIANGTFNVSGSFTTELKVYATGSTGTLKVSTYDATSTKKVIFGQGASQLSRWEFVVTGAESSGNAGSLFTLDACDDSGTKIDSAISIVRASGGAMTLTRPLKATAGIDAPITTNAQTGTSYTLVLGDAGYQVEMNNASANTLTVPLNSSVAFPVGTQIAVLQTGAGQTTIAATGGVTINGFPGLKLVAQWAGCVLTKRATNTWVVQGSLTA